MILLLPPHPTSKQTPKKLTQIRVIWSLVKYLNPADRNPRKITKAHQDFAKKLDFKSVEFPVKFRDIHKIEKTNSIGIS